jgi:hypothetical protein
MKKNLVLLWYGNILRELTNNVEVARIEWNRSHTGNQDRPGWRIVANGAETFRCGYPEDIKSVKALVERSVLQGQTASFA